MRLEFIAPLLTGNNDSLLWPACVPHEETVVEDNRIDYRNYRMATDCCQLPARRPDNVKSGASVVIPMDEALIVSKWIRRLNEAITLAESINA